MTRKDPAAAFRRVNPQTTYDIERVHKRLQGRARPREQRLYADWARLLDAGPTGDWIADCALAEFIDVLRTSDRDQLPRRAEAFGGDSAPDPTKDDAEVARTGGAALGATARPPLRKAS